MVLSDLWHFCWDCMVHGMSLQCHLLGTWSSSRWICMSCAVSEEGAERGRGEECARI